MKIQQRLNNFFFSNNPINARALSLGPRLSLFSEVSYVVIQNEMFVFTLISLPVLSLELWHLKRFAPCTGIRIPEFGKFLLVKSRILEMFACGFRNPGL